MTEISPGQAPDQSPSVSAPDPDDKPALPVQGADDTDVGWGDLARSPVTPICRGHGVTSDGLSTPAATATSR
jgi:hypothetical protein